MTVDKWFKEQSTLIKVLLLIIPFVGWVTEVLVRLSVALRTKETRDIVLVVVFGLFGILSIVDLVYMLIKGHLYLME